MKKEMIVVMAISFIIILCFSLIDLGIDYEILHDENEYLQEMLELKNEKIDHLEECCDKLFEELEYVKYGEV